MAQYLNINVRVPLPDDALMSAQIQTTALTCAQTFRDDIQQKMKQVGVQPDMTAAVVRVKGPKTKSNALQAAEAMDKKLNGPVQTDIEDAIAATKPAEREIADEPVQQRAPTPPWAQQ